SAPAPAAVTPAQPLCLPTLPMLAPPLLPLPLPGFAAPHPLVSLDQRGDGLRGEGRLREILDAPLKIHLCGVVGSPAHVECPIVVQLLRQLVAHLLEKIGRAHV